MAQASTPLSSKQDDKKPKTVGVIYNGRTKQFDYDGDELVGTLLAAALDEFGVTSNRHLMSLFAEDGTELPEDGTLKHAKVKRGDVLVLRQSIVKGG